MDAAIQTNKNGIDTLTKRVNELKDQFSALKDELDLIDLMPIVQNQDEQAKKIKINGQRIATLRELDLQTQINDLLSVVKGMSLRIGALEKQNDELRATDVAFATKIDKMGTKIALNTEIILENATELKVTEDDIEKCFGKIDKALGTSHDSNINISLLRSKLDQTDKVVDGCIIGVDKNASDVKKNAKNIELGAHAALMNDSNITELIKIAKRSNDALDMVRVQTQTNATNIRKK